MYKCRTICDIGRKGQHNPYLILDPLHMVIQLGLNYFRNSLPLLCLGRYGLRADHWGEADGLMRC